MTRMKAGNGPLLRAIFRTMLANRYAFDAKMLVISSLFNLTVKEMPVKVTIKKRFKFKEILRMAIDVAAIGYILKINHWYHKRAVEMYISTLKINQIYRLSIFH
jgi:hypothetical protein